MPPIRVVNPGGVPLSVLYPGGASPCAIPGCWSFPLLLTRVLVLPAVVNPGVREGGNSAQRGSLPKGEWEELCAECSSLSRQFLLFSHCFDTFRIPFWPGLGLF